MTTAHANAAPQQETVLDLSAVTNARRWLRRRLKAIRLSAAAGADVELVASELIANAFLHGSHPRSLWLRTLPGHRVRITVCDGSLEPPRLKDASSSDTRGRGLRVVAGLADRWGTSTEGNGKAVWAELTLPTYPERVFADAGGGTSSTAVLPRGA